MADVIEVPRPTANATSLAEFKAAKAAPAPAAEPKPTPAPSEPPAGESAPASEAANQEPQESKGKRDRSAEGRAGELAAQGRYDEARKILEAKDKKRDDEIAELRRKLEAPPQVAKPAAEPEAPKPVSTPSGEPKLKEFLANPKNKDREYEDVLEEFIEARDTFRENKRKAEAESGTRQKTVGEKIAQGRSKYGADFEGALKVTLHNSNLDALVNEFDNGMDVLYALHQDPAEHQRVAALSPARQLVELGYIARDLAAEAAPPATPERPKPAAPVSRTPPPARSIGGIAPATPKFNGPPTSLAEHRARRAAK